MPYQVLYQGPYQVLYQGPYQECQALVECQVSCVPNPDMGLVCPMEEVDSHQCVVLQMGKLSPGRERREVSFLYRVLLPKWGGSGMSADLTCTAQHCLGPGGPMP